MRVFQPRFALVLLLAVAGSALAGDIDEVAVPPQACLDGHATGQEQHFRRAFAADAMLFGLRDGQYSGRTVEDCIARAASGRPPPDEVRRRRRIQSITVTGKVATAVIELDYPSMKALDHMSLLTFEDGWRIVVKTYKAITPTWQRDWPECSTRERSRPRRHAAQSLKPAASAVPRAGPTPRSATPPSRACGGFRSGGGPRRRARAAG